MNQILILYPMIALVAWTILICFYLGYKRFNAGAKNLVTLTDFEYGESLKVPSNIKLPNQNFINLFEMPILFYLACITTYVTQLVDMMILALAWGYVSSRVVHSLIHITYNHVLHRFIVFALSCVIITMVWVLLFNGILNKPFV